MGKTIIVKGADFSTNAIGSGDVTPVVTTYSISYDFTDIDAANKPSSVNAGTNLVIQLVVGSNYGFPDTVSVVNTSTGVAVSGVSYDQSSGVISIPAVNCNIRITASGKANVTPVDPDPQVTTLGISYSLSNVGTTTRPTSYNSGETVTVVFSEVLNYDLPTSVEVYNDDTDTLITSGVSYVRETGTLTITGATVALRIVASGVAEEQEEEPEWGTAKFTEADCSNGGGVVVTENVSGVSPGGIDTTYNANWKYSGFLDVSSYEKFKLATNSKANNYGLAWYGSASENSYISGILFDNNNSSDTFVRDGNTETLECFVEKGNIPTGAAYCRFCYNRQNTKKVNLYLV